MLATVTLEEQGKWNWLAGVTGRYCRSAWGPSELTKEIHGPLPCKSYSGRHSLPTPNQLLSASGALQPIHLGLSDDEYINLNDLEYSRKTNLLGPHQNTMLLTEQTHLRGITNLPCLTIQCNRIFFFWTLEEHSFSSGIDRMVDIDYQFAFI